MSSHNTIRVKYIPSTTIDYFNTLISGVETFGCSFTLHVETFSCRVSRADKQGFEMQRKEHQQRGNSSNSGSTPSYTHSTSAAVITPQQRFEDDDFRFDNDPPPSSQSQQNAAFPPQAFPTSPPATPPVSFISPLTGGGTQSHSAHSGRPCFPEYFVLPSSVTNGGMGTQQISGVSIADVSNSTNDGIGMQSQGVYAASAPTYSSPNDSTRPLSGFKLVDSEGSLGVPQPPPTSHPPVPQSAEEAYALSLQVIADRLIYLVGALNSLYGTAEYDFSVLEPSDFILVNPITLINEVTGMFSQLPADMRSYTGQNGEAFWRAIGAMIGGELALYDCHTNMSECDVFLFRCPQCDPAAQTKLWSSHYFVYNKKNKVIVSMLAFTEAGGLEGSVGGVNSSGMGAMCGSGASEKYHVGRGLQQVPLETTNGEFYVDNEGNTHAIGGDHEDDDSPNINRKERGRQGGAVRSPTDTSAYQNDEESESVGDEPLSYEY